MGSLQDIQLVDANVEAARAGTATWCVKMSPVLVEGDAWVDRLGGA